MGQEKRPTTQLPDDQKATPGAQLQIDEIRGKVHKGLKAMALVICIMVVGFALTGWQIVRAFDEQENERLDRVAASASINTFLCQRIDAVGNGVAALVRISLENAPPPEQLPPEQRIGYEYFLNYVIEQERPPRCKALALKIATLTGADPQDIKITPIHFKRNTQEGDKADAAEGR